MTGTPAISKCEVCGSDSLEAVLDLGLNPLCDDLILVGDTRVCAEYPINVLFCRRCTTAHQRFQVPKEKLFPRSYHYRSRFTADVLAGMDELVVSCERRLGDLAGRTVLDVGCNDGSLLDRFAARGARTIGLEPTDACRDGEGRGHALYQRYFDVAAAQAIRAAHGAPDIVTFANVFAHIEDLEGLIATLRAVMSARTTVVVENHYLGAVLARDQFDTFYHEHPRTYSLSSFTFVAQRLAREISGVEFPSRYGGNIRVFMGTEAAAGAGRGAIADILADESGLAGRFADLRTHVERWREATKERLAKLVARHGPLSAKAFPGRAAILLRLLEADTATIAEVFEKPGSMKIGHYVPGTRIPIRSDDELFARAAAPP
ncbi:MAG: methyltransferase domain-containing protein, partial [Gemmatimonadaceae bacterium]